MRAKSARGLLFSLFEYGNDFLIMKHIALILFLLLVLPSCAALEAYTPMLSFGFELNGSKITVGIAPIPTFKKTESQPIELPAIIIPNK